MQFHDAKLSALMKKACDCMNGEHLLDVAAVCADIAVFAIYKQFEDDPEEANAALEALLEAMRAALRRSSVQ